MLSLTFVGQSVVKMLLSEGDKLLLSVLSTAHHQGIYALITNYGTITNYSLSKFRLAGGANRVFAG